MINPEGLKWTLFHWKVCVHLLLGTRRLGVNNQRVVGFDSLFGNQAYRKPWLILRNYRMAKYRATSCGFLTREECRNLGWKSEI